MGAGLSTHIMTRLGSRRAGRGIGADTEEVKGPGMIGRGLIISSKGSGMIGEGWELRRGEGEGEGGGDFFVHERGCEGGNRR
jgi:hypothetical protein